jgi:hypothetical protein
VEVRLHSLLTLAHIQVVSLTARPYLSTEKSLRYIMDRRFDGPFRAFGGREKCLRLPETEPRRFGGSDRRTVTTHSALSRLCRIQETRSIRRVPRGHKNQTKSHNCITESSQYPSTLTHFTSRYQFKNPDAVAILALA